jgi:hypothetical protein
VEPQTGRRLLEVLEPLAANVYFAPEVHAAYAAIGFEPSNVERGGVAYPDGVAYFTSRGACLGTVPGDVVASAFGVFNPPVVVMAVAEGWKRTDREQILDARQSGAVASLRRLIGGADGAPAGLARATELLCRGAEAADVAGRALFAGLSSLGWPGEPVADFWRAADLVREHRGDCHIAAWLDHDFDPVEIGVVTDLWRGMPFKSWVRSRAWSEQQLDAAAERLRSRGLLTGEELTAEGRAARDRIEDDTDRLVGRVVAAIGDDIDELIGLLRPWRDAVLAGGGYPRF